MSKSLYPLKFHTIFKDKIWGGTKIRDLLGKDFSPLPNCGETWELSGVEGDVSVVANGPLRGKTLVELIKEFKEELVGAKAFNVYGTNFPLLVKFIDANDDLSIQVHPNDQQAKKYDSFGKTEMWYIIQAEENATLITGFNKDLDKEEFVKHMENDTLEEVLNKEEVSADDVFFIPAGRIHTIGKGILLAEIQQSSDITFRIYDFNRKDAQGNLRELHVEKALDVIDYSSYPEYKITQPLEKNKVTQLVKSQYFTTNRLILDKPYVRNKSNIDSFIIYTCLNGSADFTEGQNQLQVSMGDVVLIPASAQDIHINPITRCKILETCIN